ncbi:MAG: DegT/DnrJ/EryC1/StrS family aminotransferase [Salinispira sp.]
MNPSINSDASRKADEPSPIPDASRKADEPSAIPYSRPVLGREEEEAVLRVMRSGWLTTGNEALSFEKEFASFLREGSGEQAGSPEPFQSPDPPGASEPMGTPAPPAAPERKGGGEPSSPPEHDDLHALAFSSATAALHVGIRTLGFPAGRYIALSPYTFAASAHSILYNGLIPLFIDTVPGGYHLDVEKLEQALQKGKIRRKLKGAMAVHFAGLEHGGDALDDLSRRHGFTVIEDAAHSFPAKNSCGNLQGTRGRIAVFSFYANKTITTGEGGMLIVRDPQAADAARTLRLHGINKDAWSRYTRVGRNAPWHYDVGVLGYKYNMPDILACIGRMQLHKARSYMKARRAIAERYAQAFADRDWCSLPPGADPVVPADFHSSSRHSWHIYSLRLNLKKLSISRDEFIHHLAAAGIGSSVHFIPLHLMSLYRKTFSYKPSDFPHALESYLSTISLPIFPSLGHEEIERVISTVLRVGDRYFRAETFA